MALAPTGARGGGQEFSRRQWAAMLFVVCCGFSSQMVMPLWVGAVIEGLKLDEAAAGRIGSMEFLAVAAVSLLVAFQIQKFPTRTTTILGVALLIAGNVASAFAGSELALTVSRMLCGIGKGLVVAIVFSLAAGSARPTRAFAMLNLVYALFSTAFYLAIPYAITAAGHTGAFLGMAAVAVAGALFMPFFPASRLSASELTGLRLRDLPTFGFLAFAALVILWSGHNMVWTFVERIGVRDGLDVAAIGRVLSLSAFLTIAGPGLARAIDTRLGYGVPMLVAIALKIAAVLVIGHVATALTFYWAVPAFMLLSLFITPYVMGMLSLADPAGRLAAASSAAMTAGGSLGAWLGGLALGAGGPAGLSWGSAAHFLAFTLIIVAVAPLATRHGRAKAAPAL